MKINRKKWNIEKSMLLLGIYAFIIFVIYFLEIGGPFQKTITKMIMFFTPILIIALSVKSISYFGIKSYPGKGTLFMIIALGLAWIGRTLLDFFPASKISAMYLFILMRPFFAIAIFYNLKAMNYDIKSSLKNLYVFGTLFFIFSVAYFIKFPLKLLEAKNMMGFTLDMIKIADLFLLGFILFCIHLLIKLRGGSYKFYWLGLLLGSISFWVSQAYYTINYQTYQQGSLMDLGWIFGYILFGIGILFSINETKKILDNAKKKIKKLIF